MPRRYVRRNNNTPLPPPPPSNINTAAFQAAVSTTVTIVLAHIHNGKNRGGNGQRTGSSNHGVNQGPTRTCTYKNFTNAKPRTLNGTGGVIALTRWFEKTESFFKICDCPEESKLSFDAYMFDDRDLAWWNGHVKSLTLTVAIAMSWEELKTIMLAEYCPRGEVQKLEKELWNLTLQNSDVDAYIARPGELALLCPRMITSEGKKIEQIIWGLTPPIQGNMIVANPETFDNAKCLAQKLYDHGNKKGTKILDVETKKEDINKRNKGSKRKRGHASDSSKKQQTVAVYAATTTAIQTSVATTTTTPAPARPHAGSHSECDKCSFHHIGACKDFQCKNCNRKGHIVRYCRSPPQ